MVTLTIIVISPNAVGVKAKMWTELTIMNINQKGGDRASASAKPQDNHLCRKSPEYDERGGEGSTVGQWAPLERAGPNSQREL